MAVVCVIGVLGMDDKDFRPTVFFFYLAGIILLSVVWSYIVEELISEHKKKKNAIRLGG